MTKNQKKIKQAEHSIITQAMLNWKYEPVLSADVGYSIRWDRLMKACGRLNAALGNAALGKK